MSETYAPESDRISLLDPSNLALVCEAASERVNARIESRPDCTGGPLVPTHIRILGVVEKAMYDEAPSFAPYFTPKSVYYPIESFLTLDGARKMAEQLLKGDHEVSVAVDDRCFTRRKVVAHGCLILDQHMQPLDEFHQNRWVEHDQNETRAEVSASHEQAHEDVLFPDFNSASVSNDDAARFERRRKISNNRSRLIA